MSSKLIGFITFAIACVLSGCNSTSATLSYNLNYDEFLSVPSGSINPRVYLDVYQQDTNWTNADVVSSFYYKSVYDTIFSIQLSPEGELIQARNLIQFDSNDSAQKFYDKRVSKQNIVELCRLDSENFSSVIAKVPDGLLFTVLIFDGVLIVSHKYPNSYYHDDRYRKDLPYIPLKMQ